MCLICIQKGDTAATDCCVYDRILEQFVLSQMHPLNDITTVIKYTPNVLSVNCTREMRITIVLSFTSRRAYPLQKKRLLSLNWLPCVSVDNNLFLQ